MAATGLSPVCYNHLEKKADFKCFDCKLDSIINLCPQCNIQVHSLDVFRAHRVEQIAVKDRERRLSQDVNDIEKLIAVESDILQNVLIRLKFCEQEEKDTISHLIQLQTATKKRLAEIKECETRIEKACSYLKKVSSMLTQCSSPVDNSENSEELKDAFIPEPSMPQTKTSGHLLNAPQQPYAHPAQGPAGEAQNVPPQEQPIIKLPDEIKGKDIFPVSVVGSLARNGSFWMIKTGPSDLDKQRQIQTGIRMHYLSNGFGGRVEVNVGMLCAALNRHNKEFCRVRIESVQSSGMVKLRFVDLGLVEDAPPSSLCQLPNEFVDIPFLALECCLLPNLDTQLPYEAKWCFKDLTFNKILMASLEGQVTNSKGHSVNHVMLASCGEVPVCINTKVAKLVDEQRLVQEERPLLPKAVKAENDAVTSGEVKHESTHDEGEETRCNLAPETDTREDNNSAVSDEKKEVLNQESDISVTDIPAVSVPSDDYAVIQDFKDSSPVLRAEAAEFVPLSPENDSSQSKIPFHAAVEQSSVPGIIHLPVKEDIPAVSKSSDENCETLLDTQVPVGCVDFATYQRIVTQCSMIMVPRDSLHKARFLMIRSNVRQVIEAMKCSLWCTFPEINKRLNRIFNEQAKGGNPVYLLFSGPKSQNFCGMAQMESAIDPNGSCPTLTKPFPFTTRITGRCNIKWIHAQDLFFSDVLGPDCGFSKWYLSDCGNGAEIPNKLGQIIVKAYESRTHFRSILQSALQFYQSQMIEQEVSNSTEPLMGNVYKPEEPNEGLPMSQEEDWDLEIEESLKAAKSLEAEQLDVSPVEREETSSCIVSEADEPASVKAPNMIPNDTSTSPDDGAVYSAQTSTDGDSAMLSSAQGDTSHVNAQEDMKLETNNEQVLQSEHLSSEVSNDATSEGQSCAELIVPDNQAAQVEGSNHVPDVLPEDAGIVHANDSDWESSSPPRLSTLSERESDSALVECRNASDIPSDAQQMLSSSDGSLEAHKSSSESNFYVPQSRDWADGADEPASDDVAHQENVRETNANKLTSQDELGEPEESSSFGVVASADDQECAKEPADSHSGDHVQDSDGTIVTESSSVPGDEAKVQEVNYEAAACSDGSSQIQSSLGAKNVDPHGSSEDLLTDDDDIPVEIGKEYYIFTQENLSSTGTFWARVHRTKEEEKRFIDTMERMGAHIEAKNELLDNIYIYKHCAVKGWEGYWFRALVEKTSDKGKVGIRLLDLGEYWEVHEKELRVLDDEFYAAPPAQAFECSVCYENPGSKKEKSRISRVVKKNKKIKVLVKSYNEGTVGVQVLS